MAPYYPNRARVLLLYSKHKQKLLLYFEKRRAVVLSRIFVKKAGKILDFTHSRPESGFLRSCSLDMKMFRSLCELVFYVSVVVFSWHSSTCAESACMQSCGRHSTLPSGTRASSSLRFCTAGSASYSCNQNQYCTVVFSTVSTYATYYSTVLYSPVNTGS